MNKNLREGHRKRMREKILRNGPETLYDYELVEMVLGLSNIRSDQRDNAKRLLQEFKNLSGILGARPERLKQLDGLGDGFVSIIKVLHEMFCRVNKEEMANTPLLNSPEKVFKYCKIRMAYALQEEFRIFFLNKKNYLIEDESQHIGTIDQTSIYPREVVRRTIELGASSIIMIHNHPTGDPSPSKADLMITARVENALSSIGAKVNDHIIIGKDEYFSMRGEGLLNDINSLIQDPIL